MNSDRHREFKVISQRRFAKYKCNRASHAALAQLESQRLELIQGQLDEAVFRSRSNELQAKRKLIMGSAPATGRLQIGGLHNASAQLLGTFSAPFASAFAQSCSDNASSATIEDHTNRDSGMIGSRIASNLSGVEINGHLDFCFDSLIITGTFQLMQPASVGVRCYVKAQQSCSAFGQIIPKENTFYGDIWELHQPFMFIDSQAIAEPKVFIFSSGSDLLSLHTAEFFHEQFSGSSRNFENNPPFNLSDIPLWAESQWVDPGPSGMEFCVGVGMRHWVRITIQGAAFNVNSVGDWQVSNVVPFADTNIIH